MEFALRITSDLKLLNQVSWKNYIEIQLCVQKGYSLTEIPYFQKYEDEKSFKFSKSSQ